MGAWSISSSGSSSGMRERGYGDEFAARIFQADPGLRRVRLPGVTRRKLRAAGVCLGVDQVSPAGAIFTCALLNSLPMGFYAPAQLVRDARAHGVEVRPVDVL